MGFIQDLVGKTNQVSGIEIALQDYTKRNLVSAAIQKVLGQEYKIQDRDQQDAAFYKLMQIEKWVSYAILSFVLVLVAFNIVGALWMIVLEKKKDLMVLKSMGMKDHRVKLIVLSTGLLITGLGICIGFALAVILFLLQQKYGLVPIPEGFLVDRYPIEIKWFDFLVVGLTVTGIGIVASILPARKAAVLHEAIRYE